jgi:hypothetical protein
MKEEPTQHQSKERGRANASQERGSCQEGVPHQNERIYEKRKNQESEAQKLKRAPNSKESSRSNPGEKKNTALVIKRKIQAELWKGQKKYIHGTYLIEKKDSQVREESEIGWREKSKLGKGSINRKSGKDLIWK